MLSPPGTNATSPVGCYVPTGSYGGEELRPARRNEPTGMSLATAMTISGAALSPNWGYHSSPITAFLMTLFNVRLGAWLPNPAVVTDERELHRGYPSQGLAAMLHDLLGTTTDTTRAIYLSDGGHFDNLGLYEMLRRRCRHDPGGRCRRRSRMHFQRSGRLAAQGCNRSTDRCDILPD